ncbi:MAG: hypothetical protein SOH81_07885 [Acetobacter sp.]|jgi:hypothetical protein
MKDEKFIIVTNEIGEYGEYKSYQTYAPNTPEGLSSVKKMASDYGLVDFKVFPPAERKAAIQAMGKDA